MTRRIIYQTQDGGIAIIIPSGELPLEEVARKDVPAGVPFKIIDTVEVPDDRTFRSAWEADMTSPHGVGIGQQAWFIEKYESEIEAINAEEAPAAPETLEAAPKDQAGFPEDFTPEQIDAAYDELVAQVAALNEQYTAAHVEDVAQWEASKAARIAQLKKMIAVQRAEMEAA